MISRVRRHPKKFIALSIFIAAALYLFWPGLPVQDRTLPLGDVTMQSWGTNSGHGNIIGIEPVMVPGDYSAAAKFEAKLDQYFSRAQSQGWINSGTTILLPEHIGTWLMAVDQGSRAYSETSSFDAMVPVIAHNLIEFAKNYFIFDNFDNVTAALIRTRTRASADAQLAVYANLSQKYGVTLVAGSSALMTPGAYPDSLSYGHGPIFNAGFVFGPDGDAQIDAVRKVHPIPSETGFITASKPEFLPTLDLSSGHKMGVLICADSWFEDTTDYLADENVDVVLVPSFLANTAWDAPWQGYLNDTPQNDNWRDDIGEITEGDAWIKYALPAQLARRNIRWGMNVFLKGKLWGQQGDGRALIIEDGTLHIGEADGNTPAIYNLWLN